MKKRVIGLILVTAIVLSACALVWAGTPASSSFKGVVAQLVKKYNVNTTSGSEFNIPVQAQVVIGSTNSAGWDGYTSGVVNKVTFSIATEGDFEGSPALKDTTISPTFDDTDSFGVTTKVTGKVKGNATITVTAEAFIGNTSLGSDSATITFTTENGTDVTDASFIMDKPYEEVPVVVEDPNPIDDTPANFDNLELWDGIDPSEIPSKLTTRENGKSTTKDKPKVNTSTLTFNGTGATTYAAKAKALNAGGSGDFTVEVQGDSLDIDVYIAAGDAIKLWPLSCDAKNKKTYVGSGNKWTENISLTRENIKKWKIPFRITNVESKISEETKTKDQVLTTLTIAYNGAQVAYKGFPLTFALSNNLTKTTKNGTTTDKPVTKAFKIDINSTRSTPQWVTSTGEIGDKMKTKNAQDLSVALADGGTLGGTVYTVSADGPYYITAKGDKIGISSDIVQPVLGKYGEVTEAGYAKVYGTFDKSNKGTNNGTKETKVTFTLDATGSFKKTTFKPNVIGKVSPYYEAKSLVTSKDTTYAGVPNTVTGNAGQYDGYLKSAKAAEAGKVPTVKFAPKGSKTITFDIDSDSLAALNNVGLSFDRKTGAVVQLQETVTGTDGKTKKVKVPTTPTLNADGDAYEPIDIEVTADNGTGHTAPLRALVGVTGAKPTLGKVNKGVDYSKITLEKSNLTPGTAIPIKAMVGKYFVTPESGDAGVAIVTYALQNKKASKTDTPDTDALESLGLAFYEAGETYYENGDSEGTAITPVFPDGELSPEQSTGYFMVTSTDIHANNKGAKINLVLENFGATNNVNTTIIIRDVSPEITTASGDTITLASTATKQTFTLPLTVSNLTAPDAKISWKISKLSDPAPKKSKTTELGVAIKATDSKKGLTADVTITVMSCDYDGEFTVTATNTDKRFETKTFNLKVTPPTPTTTTPVEGEDGGSRRTRSAYYDEAQTQAESDEEAAEELKLTFGAPRTAANLTAAQKAFLATKGYTVIAVLPEVTADKDGQAEIAVELIEDAPEGAKLVYIPFPKNAEETDDDKIADFYDENGAAIEEVPAAKNITVAPWFRAGVTYEPVIAAESK